jgi:Zn-dependent protease with chaperone function
LASERIWGKWYPPGSARSTGAVLALAGGVLSAIEDGGVRALASAPLSAIEVSSRIGSIPRRITFPDGSVFETSDNDGVDRLLPPRAGRGFVHGLEQFRPRLVLLVVAVLALGFALYRYTLPVLVEAAIAVTPPVVPELLSQSVLASLDQTVFGETGLPPERQKAIADAFGKIAALTPRGMAAPAAEPAYTLNFRKGGIVGPNAFALPDGSIVLTDELIELAKDDEMVLGVLAHEIGHVDKEHSLRQLYRAAGATALIMLIAGDIGSGTEDILVQGSALVSLSHTRAAEREADRYSVELMHRAGYDPAAIVRFFELIRDKLGDTSEDDFLSTHPATPERIEETRKYAEEIAGKQ